MKRILFFILLIPMLGIQTSKAQVIYSTTGGEMIFSGGNVEFTEQYMLQYPDARATGVPMRFTSFFHFTQYWHMDFNKNLGIYTGLGLKNVGLISDEKLYNDTPGIESYQNYKINRRVYTGGIPLALKVGAFNENMYFFGGGEIEFPFHYKEKYWNSTSRSGEKTKYKQWFGSQTQTLLPSVIAGIQFPGGINVKFNYYLSNFLNNRYTDPDFVSDLSRYKNTQIWYVSLSWQFKTGYLWGKEDNWM